MVYQGILGKASVEVISGSQIRAARAVLGWSAEETADRAKVTRKTVERLERAVGVPSARALTVDSLKTTFEAAGIEFVGTPEEGPGVRLWANKVPKFSRKGPSQKRD